MQPVSVRCRSEFTYAQDPIEFAWDEENLTIGIIGNRWRSPQGPVFEVQATNGGWFRLCYIETEDHWYAEMIVR